MQERLQKLIAQAGIASRRAAEELIRSGEVSVNGETVTELGTKADPETDHIKVGGKLINARIRAKGNTYLLLNKPKAVLSSSADPEGRRLVVDLVKGFGKLHPVGRLDYNSEGLIILTNDGDFTNLVASSKKIPKIYEVKVKGLPPAAAINKLRRGIRLEDGYRTAPAEIGELKSTDKNGWYEVTLYEGHNQQIRKMFDAIGHSVVKLRRTAIGNIRDPYLVSGAYRKLTAEEVRDAIDFKRLMRNDPGRRKKTDQPNRPNAKHAAKRSESKSATRVNKRLGASASGARPSGKGPARP